MGNCPTCLEVFRGKLGRKVGQKSWAEPEDGRVRDFRGDRASMAERVRVKRELDVGELRQLKRRAGIAEETVRIKKERLDEAEQEYDIRRSLCSRSGWRRSGSNASTCWLEWHVMQA